MDLKHPPTRYSLFLTADSSRYTVKALDLLVLMYGAGLFFAFCVQSQMKLEAAQRPQFWILIAALVGLGIYLRFKMLFRVSMHMAMIIFGGLSIYAAAKGIIVAQSMNVFAMAMSAVLIVVFLVGLALLVLARSIAARESALKAAKRKTSPQDDEQS